MKKIILVFLLALTLAAGFLSAEVWWEEDTMEDLYENLQYFDIPEEEWPSYIQEFEETREIVEDFLKDFSPEEDHKIYVILYDFWDLLCTEGYGPCLGICNDSYELALCNMTLTEEGLRGSANFSTAGGFFDYVDDADVEFGHYFDNIPSANLIFDDFLLRADGTFESGISNNENYENIYHGDNFDLLLEKAHLELLNDEYVVVADSSELYDISTTDPVTGMEAKIKFGRIVFDMMGTIIDMDVDSIRMEPVSRTGESGKTSDLTMTDQFEDTMEITISERYKLSIESFEITEGGLLCRGTFSIPELNYSVHLGENPILIGKNWYYYIAYIDDRNCPGTFSFRGFNFTAGGLYVEYDTLKFYDVKLLFKDSEIPVGDVFFEKDYYYSYYSQDEGDELSIKSIENQKPFSVNVPIFTEKDFITGIKYSDGVFVASVFINLPGAFAGTPISLDVILTPDGNAFISDYTSYSGGYFYLGKIYFHYDYKGIDYDYETGEGYFWFDDLSMSLPANGVLTGCYPRYLKVGFDGTVSIVSWGYPFNGPASICGMSFIADDMTFGEDSFVLEGTLYLPDSFPSYYNRVEASIEIGYDGALRDFSANYNGWIQMRTETGWYINTKGYLLELTQEVNEDGSLAPAVCRVLLNEPAMYSYYNNQYYSNNFNLEEASFIKSGNKWLLEYDKLALSETTDIWSGAIKFTADSLSATASDMTFSGNFSISDQDNVPELLRDLAGSGLFILDSTAAIKDFSAKFPAVNGTFATKDLPSWCFTAEDAEAGLVWDRNTSSIILELLSGKVRLSDNLPEMLAGRELSLVNAGFNLSERKMTGLLAESPSFNEDGLSPQMEDLVIKVDSDSIEISGSVPSASGDVQDYFGKPADSVNGTMRYGVDGSPESFTVEYIF